MPLWPLALGSYMTVTPWLYEGFGDLGLTPRDSCGVPPATWAPCDTGGGLRTCHHIFQWY